MLEPPTPLSHLCPACKLWPCGEDVCVWMRACGWPDCYTHYSGLQSVLVIITCLLERSRGFGGDRSSAGGIPAFPVLSCSERDAKPHRSGSAGDEPPSSPPPSIFNHCATMQSYTQAQVYEYTSIQYHLFSKYVKLWRRRRSNTVPRSQITMYGALCFCS